MTDFFNVGVFVILVTGVIAYGVVSILIAHSIHKSRKTYYEYLKTPRNTKTLAEYYNYYYKVTK